MNLEQLKKLIISEHFDLYLDFYIGDLLAAENTLSLKKVSENKFSVRKTGERGMKTEYTELTEAEACEICLKYFNYAKILYEYQKKNKQR